MPNDLTISQARNRLSSLPEELDKSPGTVTVTRHGKPVLAILPWEAYEALAETLEILGDRDLTDRLRESIAELKRGEAMDWEAAKQDLGL